MLGPDPAMPFPLPHGTRLETRSADGIRGVTHQNAIEALAEAGFWVLRTGVHVVMTDGKRILTIPCQDPIHSQTMEGIVRDSGLSVEQFRDLL
jgi:predicted RNA binding protein YcfA (HicA-like mRNA interferase family)